MKLDREESEGDDQELLQDTASQNSAYDPLLDQGLGYNDMWGGQDAIPPMEKHNDLLKELTNFNPYIKDKVNGWLGLVWSETNGKWVRDSNIRPIMNKRCAAWCIDYLKTYTRNNNIITNIGRKEYEFLIMDIIEVVWLDIGTRCETFGIRGNADLHRICIEMQHAAELILMGAGDGKYNKLLQEATTRHENVSIQPGMDQQQYNIGYGMGVQQPKKLSAMGKLKKFLTGG